MKKDERRHSEEKAKDYELIKQYLLGRTSVSYLVNNLSP
jgi:hypothetical protein